MDFTNALSIKLAITFISLVGIIIIATPSTIIAQTANEDIKAICAKPENKNSALCVGYIDGEDDAENKNPVLRIITSIIGILFYAAGALAVIMVIYGGFRFVTSTGEAQKVADARKTIFYALIGLVVIVISRQVILFILSKFT